MTTENTKDNRGLTEDPPKDLRELKQWLNWTDDKGNKIPKQVNGQYGKSNDPTTWASYQSVKRVAEKFSGIAFVISDEDDFCGIDLDNCLDENGELREWARRIVSEFDGVACAEISPSGRGIKLITRGRKTDAARCVHKIADDKQQIECYDKARFWTITGDVYNNQRKIRDGQEAVDWLCNEYLTTKPQKTAKVPTESPASQETRIVQPGEDDLRDRAQAYVDAVPNAPEGDRNNQVFKLSGNLYALDHEGQRLTDEQVLDYCRIWNDRLAEPLDEEELQKAVRSGMTNGTPRATKPADELLTPNPNVDLSELTFKSADSKSKQSGRDDCGVPQELIDTAPGMLGEIILWMRETALYELPEAFLASALALLSVITGRKVRDSLGNRTNLFVLTVAPTASGKDHPRTKIQDALEQCGASDLLGPEDIGSAPGLCNRLVEHPATLFQLDEFGHLVAAVSGDKAPPHMKQVGSDLLRLYTSSDRKWTGRAYADKGNTPVVDQPHAVINGTTTAEVLWSSLSSEKVNDGLLGRIHVFESQGYTRFSRERAAQVRELDDEIPQRIRDFVEHWVSNETSEGNLADTLPSPAVITHAPDAWDRYSRHQEEISIRREKDSTTAAAIWSRSGQHAGKLATIAACARQAHEITLDDVNWAIALQNALTRRLLIRIGENVADSEFERQRKSLLKKVQKAGQLTKHQLTRKTPGIRKRDRDEMITHLFETGQIEVMDVGEGTSKTRRISYVQPPETGL